LCACFLVLSSSAQTGRILSVYLQVQYTHTLSDRTPGNNPWAPGVGLQTFLNTGSRFKPVVECTADAYLYDDKVMRLTPDEEEIESIDGVVNLFAGASFHPDKLVYLSLSAGPSFINGRTLAGIKPSFGFYLSRKQRWIFKASYIHVFNREPLSKLDFSSASFALGCRLF
ncbi:MAG: hypothetical protein ABW019_18430, partial [Chitinophagaceae bacterium]